MPPTTTDALHPADLERQRHLALDAITDFAYTFDLEGRFTFINKALLDLWGLTLHEAVGKNFFDLKYPDPLASRLQDQIQQVIESRQSLVDETPYTSPTGAGGYYQYIFTPVIENGCVIAVAGSTRDITSYKNLQADREKLTRDIDAERLKLANIVKAAPAFICILNGPDHLFELANERYYDLVGRRTLIGRPVREVFPEIHGQGFFELLDNVYATGKTFVGNEVPVTLRRGTDQPPEQRYINFVYQALRNSTDQISGIFVHGVDVTESVHAREGLREREERLRTSEERLAFALDAGDLGTFYCPMPLGEIIWNTKCKEHFGLPGDAKIDFDVFYERIHPDDRERTRLAVEQTVFHKQPYDIVYRTVAPDGHVRHIRAKGRAYHDAHGNPTRFDGVTLDVTEQKNAEAALLASEQRFRTMADTMPQMIWVTRPDGYHEYYNRRWYEFTGVPDGSTDGEGWNDMFHPEDQPRAWTAWKHSLTTGDPYEIEYRLKHHSGEYRWTLGRALPVKNDAGQIVRWFGTCTDIHAIKQLTAEREHLLESERAARADAENANLAKDKFIAVLSHELRTPLTPVTMTIPAMELDPELPAKFREDLAMIRRNIDLEVKLIDDLLDLSRVSTGKLRLHMQEVSVHEVLTHAIHSSLSDTANKQLHLTTDFKANPDHLVADPARLQQVFWNLLRNAVKFTPEGGSIAVRTKSDHQHRIHIEVADSGVGIPPDVLPKIFDAFEQGDSRVTRQFGGLGLGLAIAKAVVELHGGAIAATSKGANQGATFTVTLTASPAQTTAPAAAPAATAATRANLPPAKILLVEDHPDTARSLARILNASGFHCKTAHSVADALHLATLHPFDILVSDIGLPDATGYDLMKQLAARYPIKGIALSGYGMEEDARKSREAGFTEHLIKPVNIAHLESTLHRVLNNDSLPLI